VLGLSGTATGTFDGQAVDATTVLVKYTYRGDADLSGAVTLDDFTLFLSGYQRGGTDWFQGAPAASPSTTSPSSSTATRTKARRSAPSSPSSTACR
jgi:hypothetical protein